MKDLVSHVYIFIVFKDINSSIAAFGSREFLATLLNVYEKQSQSC